MFTRRFRGCREKRYVTVVCGVTVVTAAGAMFTSYEVPGGVPLLGSSGRVELVGRVVPGPRGRSDAVGRVTWAAVTRAA